MGKALFAVFLVAVLAMAGIYFIAPTGEDNAIVVLPDETSPIATEPEPTTVSPIARAVEEAAPGTPSALAEIFSSEGFDYDAARAALMAADLDPLTKQGFATALDGAQGDRQLLETVLGEIRSALGLS